MVVMTCGVGLPRKMKPDETGLTKSNQTLTSLHHGLYSFSNSLHKWGEVRQLWTGLPKMEQSENFCWPDWLDHLQRWFPNILVRRNPPKFQESLHWHNGKHPRFSLMCRCTVAWQVRSWRVPSLFFLPLSIKHTFELRDLATEAGSEVNGVSWQGDNS